MDLPSGPGALAAAELSPEPSCLVCSACSRNSWKCFVPHKPTPRNAALLLTGLRQSHCRSGEEASCSRGSPPVCHQPVPTESTAVLWRSFLPQVPGLRSALGP